jgi:hypothetical protein
MNNVCIARWQGRADCMQKRDDLVSWIQETAVMEAQSMTSASSP